MSGKPRIVMEGREQRIRKVLSSALILLLSGAVYALFCTYTHIYIPCVFNLVTGLRCPGCGITHCFLALLEGDLPGAFEANQFVFCMLPVGIVYAGYRVWKYVQYAGTDYTKGETLCIWTAVAAALLFGAARNIDALHAMFHL